MKTLNNIRKAIKRQNAIDLKDKLNTLSEANTIEEIKSKWYLNQYFTPYSIKKEWESVKECKSYLADRIKKAYAESLEKKLKRIDTVLNSGEFVQCTITVEWKKNRTWGSNPRAEARFGFISCSGYGSNYISGSSISGCGYDKQSTAVAEVINQINPILKALYIEKNKAVNIDRKNGEVFGYGSGYNLLPNIEGGVGVGCYPRIFEAIGMKFETVSSGSIFDVYRITNLSKKVKKHLK